MVGNDLLQHIYDDRRRPDIRDQSSAHDFNDPFIELLNKIRVLHAAKGEDYGDRTESYSNFKRSTRLGISPFMGCLVRLSDKWERVVRLSQHEAHVKDESLRDTLLDMSVYALIAIVLHDEEAQG